MKIYSTWKIDKTVLTISAFARTTKETPQETSVRVGNVLADIESGTC